MAPLENMVEFNSLMIQEHQATVSGLAEEGSSCKMSWIREAQAGRGETGEVRRSGRRCCKPSEMPLTPFGK